ncbi:hypothetical protein EVAR_11554_1 [Eumeta japonica]|uniref:Uncharacterized protein n=1 Tax=Eumeta variegata TaxID=151549 RepID=A0A4C1TYS9_EUMVA|nr:hypothetical protein EVAR_11554_1 [Eumeta japonica]
MDFCGKGSDRSDNTFPAFWQNGGNKVLCERPPKKHLKHKTLLLHWSLRSSKIPSMHKPDGSDCGCATWITDRPPSVLRLRCGTCTLFFKNTLKLIPNS